jgi:CubicO group peptidase (beta-lactamase class C family)
LKFLRMILNRGAAGSHRVLRPETVDLMARDALGTLEVTALRTVEPAASNDAEFFPGLPKGWGLTFMINREPAPTGRSAGSLAWAGMANTYFWVDPTRGVGGVLAAQLFPFADERLLRAFQAFETTVYQTLNEG